MSLQSIFPPYGQSTRTSAQAVPAVAAALQNYKELILLVAVASGMTLFTFKGFATGDSIRYALDARTMLENGLRRVSGAFNGEMSFGYYLMLYAAVKISGSAANMSGLMNSLNAAASVIFQVPLYVLFVNLTRNKTASVFACLMVLFAPAVWFQSHYGHPGMISLTFFTLSLAVFDTILRGESRNGTLMQALFVVSVVLALAVRMDILLAFGAYIGLLIYRKKLTPSWLLRAFALGGLAVLLVFVLRVLVLGFLVNPGDNTVSVHFAQKLDPGSAGPQILKNTVLWAMAAGPLMLLLGLAGVVRSGIRSPLSILLILWVVPWCVFLPFRGMDFARICIPTIPVIALAAALFVSDLFKQRQTAGLLGMLVLTQVVSVIMYYPLVNFYQFKFQINGRPIAAVPIGFLPEDHHLRQLLITASDRVAAKVTAERDRDVVIAGEADMIYERHLVESRHILSATNMTLNGLEGKKLQTAENAFFLVNLTKNAAVPDQLARITGYFAGTGTLIHLDPYSSGLVLPDGELYLRTETRSKGRQ